MIIKYSRANFLALGSMNTKRQSLSNLHKFKQHCVLHPIIWQTNLPQVFATKLLFFQQQTSIQLLSHTIFIVGVETQSV